MNSFDLHSVNPAGFVGTFEKPVESAPAYRIEWCGRIKVYQPVKESK